MRIAILSNTPVTHTGYGVQVKHLITMFRALGHDAVVIAYYGIEGGIHVLEDGTKLYPKGYDPYGNDIADAHRQHAGADILMSLTDAWVLDPQAMGTRWVPLFPVDHEPIPPAVINAVSQSFYPIVYSKFAADECRKAGLDAAYVPHAVDCSIYKPGDRAAARKAIGMPEDTFVVGMVAMNKGFPSRKCFPQLLEGFALFKRRTGADAVLYLHTQAGTQGELGGINLPAEIDDLGLTLGEDVLFCAPYANLIGFPDEYMVNAYNSMDVLLAATIGEGFGVPILEAQACDIPVIVGDWTAMPELCFAGWKIGKDEAFHWRNSPQRAWQWIPQPKAVAEYLEAAWSFAQDDACRHGDSARARSGALAYDIPIVQEVYWRTILDDIADRLGLPKPEAIEQPMSKLTEVTV